MLIFPKVIILYLKAFIYFFLILFEINIYSIYFFISSDFFQEQNKADPDAIVPHNPSPDSQNNIFQ